MMNRVGKIFLGIILALSGLSVKNVHAQDAAFSQYYASALYLNPALAGAETRMTIGLNSRMQWNSIVTPYFTNQFSFIVPLYRQGADRNFGGLGLSVYNDRSGDGNLMTTGANFNLAYNLNFSEKHALCFGVQGGIIQKSINFNKLQWGTQYDPYNGFNSDPSLVPNQDITTNSKIYPDVSAGLMYYINPGRNIREKGGSYFFGVAAYHLNTPNESLFTTDSSGSDLPMLYKAHTGAEFTLGESFNLSPNVLFAYQNGLYQFNGGLYGTLMFGDDESNVAPNALILGAWYRLNDSYIALLGVGSQAYTLGFSFDYNSSALRTNTRGKGAYEVSLVIRIPRPKRPLLPPSHPGGTPRI